MAKFEKGDRVKRVYNGDEGVVTGGIFMDDYVDVRFDIGYTAAMKHKELVKIEAQKRLKVE